MKGTNYEEGENLIASKDAFEAKLGARCLTPAMISVNAIFFRANVQTRMLQTRERPEILMFVLASLARE